MKRITGRLAAIAVAGGVALAAYADNFVILHTNDTHSQIDPTEEGRGGVLRRKVLIDSIRAAEPNVMLIDAGDVVQGTLYYILYGGDVEHLAMKEMGYDLAILGNHEFDNGVDELVRIAKIDGVKRITSNYRFDEGSAIDSLFVPYDIRDVAGRRIGFMGINLDPNGIISASKSKGVKYVDQTDAANYTAWYLKNFHDADFVVAVTHIGYNESLPGDSLLITNSRDIDLVIGGHSHDEVSPLNPADSKPWHVANRDGRLVPVVQTGSKGENLGYINIDFGADVPKVEARLMPVDSRYDSRVDPEFQALLAPYRHKVDSLMSIRVSKATEPLSKLSIINNFTDLLTTRGKELTGRRPDLVVLNNGGIRNTLPAGNISEGHLMMVFPFNNYVSVVEIKGSDLLNVFDEFQIRDITGVSSNVDIAFDPDTRKVVAATIDGRPVDPDRTYLVETIDYLAEGGDYLKSFTKGTEVARSATPLRDDVVRLLSKHKGSIRPDDTPRVHPR